MDDTINNALDDAINQILNDYRSNFTGGIIPHEDKLRIAFYCQFGMVKCDGKEMSIHDSTGNVILKYEILDGMGVDSGYF